LRGRGKSGLTTEKALGGEIASLLAGKNIFVTPTASPSTSHQNIKVPEESLTRSDSQQSLSGSETPKSADDSKSDSLTSSTNNVPSADNQEGIIIFLVVIYALSIQAKLLPSLIRIIPGCYLTPYRETCSRKKIGFYL